jgi:exo-beta-1,3-glucanase (GH17 family)
LTISRIKPALTLMVGFFVLMVSGTALAQTFVGIDYGPFHDNGQAPGTAIPDSQFKHDLQLLSTKFTVIKTYGDDSQSRLDRVVPLAAKYFPKLQIYQGVFEDTTYNSSNTTTYLDTAISLANMYPDTVAAIVVGNECLPTDSNPNPVSPTQLALDIQYVRTRLTNPSVKVTTGFGYQAAISYGTQLEPDVDSIMINIYPFYAPVAIGDAFANLTNAYNMFVNMFPGKQVIVGETGWPSSGGDMGSAVPSVANEESYVSSIFMNSSQLGSTFLFEGFNEPWLSTQNSWGPHWGLWKSNRNPKFPISIKKWQKAE